MYRWYQASAVCYVLFSDVEASSFDEDCIEEQIKSSVWFARGWTLQELIAPRNVVFYNRQWTFLGTKLTLNRLLEERTGIDEAILNGESPSKRSIAQRMSWASKRTTTRTEDMAYCLLGIFEMNIPLLYGEGDKAFLRLQLEIVKESDDHSIFAWPTLRRNQPGLLAESPVAFTNCQDIKPVSSRKGRSLFTLTNRGLSMKFMASPFTTDTYLVRLDCVDRSLLRTRQQADDFRLGMFLRRLSEDDLYARVRHNGSIFMQTRVLNWELSPNQLIKQIEVNIRQQFRGFNECDSIDRTNGFRIAETPLLPRLSSGAERFKVSASNWDPHDRVVSPKPGEFGTVGYIDISPEGHKIKGLKLAFDFGYNPVCFIASSNELPEKSAGITKHNQMTLGLISAEEQAQWLSIHQRTPFDTMAWSRINGDSALELEHHSGLWAMRGDRIHGLHARAEIGCAEDHS